MAEVQIPPGASAKDTALITLSVLVLFVGIGAFYWYEDQALAIRIAMVVAGLAVGAGLAWFSWYGREFWQFAQAARIELRKVVWPIARRDDQNDLCRVHFRHCDGLVFLGTRHGFSPG
jgi:preprotein translocase subunit SecE